MGTLHQSESILNTYPASVYTQSLQWIEWLVFQMMVGNQYLNNSSRLEGPKLCQRGPNVNQFWTLTKQVYRSNFKWTEWLVFQIMVGNYHFRVLFVHWRAKIGTLPKSEPILNTYPARVYIKCEMDWAINFPDISRKPSFSAILGPLQGQNRANMA